MLNAPHPLLQTSFVHPPSLNAGTIAAFPATGYVTAPTTAAMVLMRTRNAVCDVLLATSLLTFKGDLKLHDNS